MEYQQIQQEIKKRVIVFSSAKGGVGKTTLSCIMADKLADIGYRTLLVDTDAQGNATDLAGVMPYMGKGRPNKGYYKEALHDVILAQIQKLFNKEPKIMTKEAIYKARNFDILPCDHRSERLKYWPQENAYNFETGLDVYKIWKDQFPILLNSALLDIQNEYDFIIIDTPPELGWATENALRVNLSDFKETNVIIPIELGNFEIMGLEQMRYFIDRCSKKNEQLSLLGIVISRYGPIKANIDKDLEDGLRNDHYWNDYILDTVVTRNLLIREATLLKQSVFKYQRKKLRKNLVVNIDQFTDEIILKLHRRDNIGQGA